MPPKKRRKGARATGKGRPTGQRRRPARRKTPWLSPQRRRQVVRLGLLASGVGIIALGSLYWWVDKRVAQRLVERRLDDIPAIYSEYLRVSNDTRLSVQGLRAELSLRGYTEVTSEPDKPGEFRMAEQRITGKTRPFQLPNGQQAKSSRFIHPTDNDRTFFYLEPRIVAPLTTGEQRANRFKNLSDIPLHMRQAVIATEDERFYSHHGLDLFGIARAVFTNIRAMRLVQGGSTLTQQLAKNVLFSPQRTLWRKVSEAVAAVSIERRLTKDRILELYLNEIYLGQEGSVAIHGVAAAAMSFFGKPIQEISIAEAALLAGLIRAPSAYSPRRHPERAISRRNTVLLKMEELGFISKQQRLLAEKSRPAIVKESEFERKAPFFVEALRTELNNAFDLDAATLNGLRVYTGINLGMQECAERAVSEGVKHIEKKSPALARRTNKVEVGLVAMDPASGLVRAWVGGRDYSENQYDHVSQALRQVGSTIKPFLYLTALDQNLNRYRVARTTSILSDQPIKIEAASQKTWEPENYDKKFRGDVTVRYALENSLNLPAVYIIQRVGPPAVAATLKLFRVAEIVPAVHSLALGALDTSLLKLTAAYGALANGGIYVSPRLYTTILDDQGQNIASSPFIEEKVASESAVYVLTNIMQGVIDRGTGHSVRSLGYTRAAAGKTGTSDEARDAWFVGFTPNLVAGVWVGLDDNKKIGLSGGAAAVPVWTAFMKCVEPYHEQVDFVPPHDVTFVEIDRESGRIATSNCPDSSRVREVFVRGTEPNSTCPLHQGFWDNPLKVFEGDSKPTQPAPDRPPRRDRSIWSSIFG